MAAITPPPGTYNYRGLIITVPNPAASGKGSIKFAGSASPNAYTTVIFEE
jgi:hypothetical protein